MNKNDVPILLIGLGGIGSGIVNETYGKLRKLKNDGELNFAEALVFDTDEADLSKLENIDGSCKVQTSTDKSVRYVLERDKNAEMWFPVHPKILNMQLIKGAGQIRAVSRLALRAAMKEGKLNKIQKVKDSLYKLGSNAPEKGIRIVIVASLMGGTGSGMFLQIPLYLREIMQSQYSADRIEIQGVFILPDILKGSINGKEKVNVYANAYAAMKELNAIINYLAKDGPTVELEYKPDQIVEGEAEKGIDIKDWPYDYCYIYDKEDMKGRNIGEIDDYKHMIAENLFSQVYGPVSDALHSHFINEIRSIIRKNSKNIFGGLAIGKLIYPYEEICDYVTNKAIHESLEHQLLKIDNVYNNKIELENKNKNEGKDTEKTILSDFYMDQFETNTQDDKYFKEIARQIEIRDENGEAIGCLADDYLNYFEDEFTKQAEGFATKFELKQMSRQALENAPEGKIRNIITNKEDEYKEFRKLVDTKMESMGEMRANSDFKLDDGKEESKLDQFLKADGKYVNPVGIRYLLYRMEYDLRGMKDQYANQVESMRADISNRETNKVGKLFKNKTTLAQALDHALKANKNPADKVVFKTFQKFKDEYQEESVKHYNTLIDYARAKYAYGYCNTMYDLIGRLIEEYEGMFNKLEEQKSNISKRIVELEQRESENRVSPNIYILKKREYRQKLWDSIPADERVNNLSEVLPEKMHESLKVNCKNKIKGEDANVVGYETLFNKLIMEGCKDSIKKKHAINDLIDINILRAMEKEYQFAKELGEISDVKNEEAYVNEKLKELINLTKPFMEDSEEVSNFLVWAIHDGLMFSSEQSSDKPKIVTMLENVSDDGKRIVEDKQYSEYELEYVHICYGMMINNFSKFCDIKGKEGEYFRCYQEVIQDVSNDFSGIGRNVEITPHIDKDWHKILPPIGHMREIEEKLEKAKAFITCLPLGYVVVEVRNISSEKTKLEFKRSIGVTVPQSIKVLGEKVEGNIAKLYDAFKNNDKIVENINQEIEKHIFELKKDTSISEQTDKFLEDDFIKKFLDFKVPTYTDIRDVLDLVIVLFREVKNMEVKEKDELFTNIINGLCEIIEEIVGPYVESDKEAVANACKMVLQKIVENSKLASKITGNSPEYTYTLGIITKKINEYKED